MPKGTPRISRADGPPPPDWKRKHGLFTTPLQVAGRGTEAWRNSPVVRIVGFFNGLFGPKYRREQ